MRDIDTFCIETLFLDLDMKPCFIILYSSILSCVSYNKDKANSRVNICRAQRSAATLLNMGFASLGLPANLTTPWPLLH